MTAYNPYLAPQTSQTQAQGPTQQWWNHGERYVPLGWRTPMAAIGIGAAVFFDFAVDVAQLALGDNLKGESPDLSSALVVFVVAMANLGALLAGAVFFGIWLHRACKNLRGLGRHGMSFTPGGSVGSFYIPFVNLARPVRAVSELWRASGSGAECDGDGWRLMGASTGLLAAWWGAWLTGNIVSYVSSRVDEPGLTGAIGLLGSAILAVAAIACILLMRGISSRQAAAAERLYSPPAS